MEALSKISEKIEHSEGDIKPKFKYNDGGENSKIPSIEELKQKIEDYR